MYDVITIGGATLDVFMHCPDLQHTEMDGQKKVMLPFGGKVEVDNALFETGGGATNTATTFARLGLNTAVVAKIGRDFSGEKVLNRLHEENINTDFVVQDRNDSTDFSTIVWKQDEGNVLLISRGKGRLEVTDEHWDQMKPKWFYISSVEGNVDLVKKVTEIKKEGKIAWNPGKMELSQKEKVLELLPNIELFILNRTEAALLTNQDSNNTESLLNEVRQLGSKTKLVTDGHNGSFYFNGGNWQQSAAFTVDRVETTGAGDAYGSAFVAGLLKELSDEQRFKVAAANAASVVSHPGAKEGILRENQIEEWMSKNLEIKTV
jgi:sugar/nucleoside kinase (ribokinase family)